jgi:hypothetical protein
MLDMGGGPWISNTSMSDLLNLVRVCVYTH